MLIRTAFLILLQVLPYILEELTHVITKGTLTYFQDKQKRIPAGKPWNH